MKLRLLPLALIALLLLAFGASVAACGEDSLTLEEYFQQLEALSDVSGERFVEIRDAYDAELAAAAPEEDVLAAYETLLANTQSIFTTFAEGLSDLNPPAVVEELHNEYADRSAELTSSTEQVLSKFGNLDSVAEVEGLLKESGANQAGDRFYETCTALQDIAAENEIDVDLDCD